MRSYKRVWVVLLAVLAAGCTFKGSTKFTQDTTDYTGDAIDSLTVSTSGETLLNGHLATDEWKIKLFTDRSFDNLQQDMARGSGEYLASFARLARIPDIRQPAFFTHARQQFGAVTQSGTITPEQLRLAVLNSWKAD